MDDIVHTVKNLTVNDAKYYESNIATASDAQGDLTRDPKTVTHTINRNFEQKILSNQTIHVLPPEINPGIDQEISLIILAPQMLLMPAM